MTTVTFSLFGVVSQTFIAIRQPDHLFTTGQVVEMIRHSAAFFRSRPPATGGRALAIGLVARRKVRRDPGQRSVESRDFKETPLPIGVALFLGASFEIDRCACKPHESLPVRRSPCVGLRTL